MKKIASSISSFLFEFPVQNTVQYSTLIAVFGLLNIVLVFPDIYDLWGMQGYVEVAVNNQFVNDFEPSLQWILLPLQYLGVGANVALLLVIVIYVLALFFVILQYQPFVCSILAWGIHVMMVTSSYYFSYGADFFITFSLFVNIFLTAGTLLKTKKGAVILQSFAIRFVQLHLCIVYFFAGFGKVLGMDWVNGDAIWYVLYAFTPETLEHSLFQIVNYPLLFMIIGWSTVCIELLYPLFIFYKKTSKIMLLSVIGMHLGIFIFMGLYTFAAVMILLNIVAFGHYLRDFKWVQKTNLLRYAQLYINKIIPSR